MRNKSPVFKYYPPKTFGKPRVHRLNQGTNGHHEAESLPEITFISSRANARQSQLKGGLPHNGIVISERIKVMEVMENRRKA